MQARIRESLQRRPPQARRVRDDMINRYSAARSNSNTGRNAPGSQGDARRPGDFTEAFFPNWDSRTSPSAISIQNSPNSSTCRRCRTSVKHEARHGSCSQKPRDTKSCRTSRSRRCRPCLHFTLHLASRWALQSFSNFLLSVCGYGIRVLAKTHRYCTCASRVAETKHSIHVTKGRIGL